MATIGFVSTRFAGSDGVSLESDKWAGVFEEQGHRVVWMAGELDRPAAVSHVVPEAHFEHPANREIQRRVWGCLTRPLEVTAAIHEQRVILKKALATFCKRFEVDMLVAENALTIPMQLSLGLALTEYIAETGIPTLAHHHDFYWERTRFSVSAVRDYLETAFPPVLPQIQHAVINSAARDELAWRKGVSSVVVPNVLDFDQPYVPVNGDRRSVRDLLGLEEGDRLILQPTRVVPRKGIEHAIQLVARLGDPRCKLVITHESGDEGDAYLTALQEMARDYKVDLRLARTCVPAAHRAPGAACPADGKLSLWDVYPCADLVTYPSLYEGFGNALLEAFYFRVPVLVNRYSIWVQDIEPKGFRTVEMEGIVTSEVVEQVRAVLRDDGLRREMAEHNYQLAARHYGFGVLRRRLKTLVANVQGLD
jgi:glycosyltransferase involved in cell wall biosynthesis